MVEIRPMTADDIEPATAMILNADWGNRRQWFQFALAQPHGFPIVAADGGEIVGTGTGSANGSVGWIGGIFVAEPSRRQGIGRALTEAVIRDLEADGCRTLLLVASQVGQILYEAMGFELQTSYATLEATGVAGGMDERVRPFASGDLHAMAALDGGATGEDRRHVLAHLASPETARVLVGAEGTLEAFVVRPPWGGGATIAATEAAGVRISEARRAGLSPERRIRAGLPAENRAGIAALERAGWTRTYRAPRMIRGEPITWQPDQIWGQFNMAMG